MTHRYTGVMGREFQGDRQKAMALQGPARLLVQQALNALEQQGGRGVIVRVQPLSDGSRITATVQGGGMGLPPIVRVQLFAPTSDKPKIETYLISGFLLTACETDPLLLATEQLGPLELVAGSRNPFWRPAGKTLLPYVVERKTFYAASVNWLGEKDGERLIVTYEHGGRSRYRLVPGWTESFHDVYRPCEDSYKRPITFAEEANGVPFVFTGGDAKIGINGNLYSLHSYIFPGSPIPYPYTVLGAAVYENHLVYVTGRLATHPVTGYQTNVYKVICVCYAKLPLSPKAYNSLEWSITDDITLDFHMGDPWFFSPDGSKAVALGTRNASASEHNEDPHLYRVKFTIELLLSFSNEVLQTDLSYTRLDEQIIYTESVVCSNPDCQYNEFEDKLITTTINSSQREYFAADYGEHCDLLLAYVKHTYQSVTTFTYVVESGGVTINSTSSLTGAYYINDDVLIEFPGMSTQVNGYSPYGQNANFIQYATSTNESLFFNALDLRTKSAIVHRTVYSYTRSDEYDSYLSATPLNTEYAATWQQDIETYAFGTLIDTYANVFSGSLDGFPVIQPGYESESYYPPYLGDHPITTGYVNRIFLPIGSSIPWTQEDVDKGIGYGKGIVQSRFDAVLLVTPPPVDSAVVVMNNKDFDVMQMVDKKSPGCERIIVLGTI